MAGEWRRERLSALCEQIADCPHSTPLWTDSGELVLRSQNIRNGCLDLSTKSYTDKAHFEQRSRRARLRGGDLVITREAPMGEVCLIPNGLRCCLGQRMVMLRPDPKKCDSRFLLYSIQSRAVQDEIKVNEGTGSTVSNLRIPLLEALPISHPPLAEQKTIAAVLGALDDKIELNRRMNATLEAMARALFQSWFVDFDPVRAKLDGRKPTALDPATAALFPDSFQDSHLGHIPLGWEVKTLSELTTLITKGTTPAQGYMTVTPDADAQINYVRVNSIDEDGAVLADKLTAIPESVHAGVLKRSILKSNDVLYTIAGTIGRIALAENWFLPANTNQAVAIIRPEPAIPSDFLVLTMRHEVFREELHNNIVHAVQANLSLGMLAKARAVVPPEATLQKLFKPISELLSKIRANRTQSRTLSTLRDTLLPKLLSGDIRVANVEEEVACV